MEYRGCPGFFNVFITDLDDETRGVHPAANSRWCLARESDWYPKWQSFNPEELWDMWNCANKNFLKIGREKCLGFCAWGGITPHISTGWEVNGWGFVKGNLDAKMGREATVCSHCRWCKQNMELYQEKQIQGNYCLLYSSLVGPVLDPWGCQEP